MSLHRWCHQTLLIANRVINVWNSLPDTVVTAPSLLSFRHQLDKFDLSSFCVNFLFLIFFLYIFFCVITVYCAHCFYVFSTYFIGVSGLGVLPLLINGNGFSRKSVFFSPFYTPQSRLKPSLFPSDIWHESWYFKKTRVPAVPSAEYRMILR